MTTAPGAYVTVLGRSGPTAIIPPQAASVFVPFLTLWGDIDTVAETRNMAQVVAATSPPGTRTAADLVRLLSFVYSDGATDNLAALDLGVASLSALFEEGAGRVYVRRLVGPEADTAALTLIDDNEDPALFLSARYAGEVGNYLNVGVSAGTVAGVKVTVTDTTGGLILGSATIVLDNLAGDAAVVAAVAAHPVLSQVLIAVAAEGSNGVDTQPEAPLAGGTSDQAGIAVTEFVTFPADLGPGVVLSLTNEFSAVLNDAGDLVDLVNDLAPILDATRRTFLTHHALTAGTSAGQLAELAGLKLVDAAAQLASDLGAPAANERLGMFGIIAGGITAPAPLSGTTFSISGAILAAGARSRAIASTGPQQPPAGIHGVSLIGSAPVVGYASPGVAPFLTATDAVNEAIHGAGLNAIRRIGGETRLYGWRTLADPASEWALLSTRDVVNAVAGEADARTEVLAFTVLDGKGHAYAQLEAVLIAVAEDFRQMGALYPLLDDDGNELDPGYVVDVAGVNTDETAAAGELIGELGIRPAPAAPIVRVYVRKAAPGGIL